MPDEVLCLHNFQGVWPQALPQGAQATAVVVCLHVFGVGVYLPDAEAFGHADVTELGTQTAENFPQGYPPVGSRLTVVVVGYAGQHRQMRLRSTASPRHVASG